MSACCFVPPCTEGLDVLPPSIMRSVIWALPLNGFAPGLEGRKCQRLPYELQQCCAASLVLGTWLVEVKADLALVSSVLEKTSVCISGSQEQGCKGQALPERWCLARDLAS